MRLHKVRVAGSKICRLSRSKSTPFLSLLCVALFINNGKGSCILLSQSSKGF